LIYVVCPNPALDRMLILGEMELDGVNRVERVQEVVAGKGINVVRAMRSIGGEALLLLFLGGMTGEKIGRGLAQEAFTFRAWAAEGETRITTIIHEEGKKRHTVLNEPGPLVTMVEEIGLRRFLEEHLVPGDYLVLSGSLPPGLRVDFYAQLVLLARHKGVRSIVDSSGEFLRQALNFSPFMVKPNVKEAEEVLAFPISSWEDKRRAVYAFLHKGVELVVLSDGARGLLVGCGGKLWRVTAESEVAGHYFIGSGDTLVGVLVQTLAWGKSVEEAIVFATACGLANTLCPGAGIFELEKARELQKVIRKEALFSE